MKRALSGLSVVELAEGLSGSYCGKLFADLGADVVKVEPPQGDVLRRIPDGPAHGDGRFRGGAFLHHNTNKRSVVADPDSEPDRGLVANLVSRADLVISSTGRGQLGLWGLDWETLHSRHPNLSTVHISGFGATGPYADYAWNDIVVQAVSGVMLLQNNAEQDPLRFPGTLGDCFIGNMAALGALAAVMTVEGGGQGVFVDLSAVEAMGTIPSRQAPLLSHQYRDREPVPGGNQPTTITLIPTGVFPCGDGYMAMMSTPQQLGEMLEVLGDDDLKEAFARPDAFDRPETKEILDVALYPWLMDHSRAEATAAAQKVGWPLAGVNSVQEVLDADHFHQRNFWVHADDPVVGSVDLPGPWCRFAEGGWALRRLAPELGEHSAEVKVDLGDSPAATLPAPDRVPAVSRPPLAGVRVLDLTTVWAGPYATMLLADLGAEVIRVENPWVLPPTTKGYHARPVLTNAGYLGSMYAPTAPGQPDRPWNRHAMNNSLARNKLSCTIDTRRPEGRELLMQLAEKCDVFIDNFKANGLARIGIEVSELQARNPRLIIVRFPPAGLTGDWSGYTGFGSQFDGLTGLLSLCGHRDSDLTTSPATTYMDGASGPAGAFATIAALRYRAATGRGQLVELAQAENVINHLGDVMVESQLGLVPRRMGNRDRWKAPQGLYPCAGEQQWLAISVTDDPSWKGLTRVIGHPELGDDPAYQGVEARIARHDEIDQLIVAWSEKQSALEAFHTLQAAGVAAGPLLDDDQIQDDPHMVDREWLQPLHSGDVGTHLHPGWAFRGVYQVWRRGSPTLGEDNEYVYKQILGTSDEDFELYRQDKILAEDYLDPDGEPY